MRILLIRLDKIGDLVSTLAVDQSLTSDCEVMWVIGKGLGFIPEHGTRPRRFLELDKSQPDESAKQLKVLLSEFKPDLAISFQGPWWISWTLFKARVPLRVGNLSQWHSFFFLNKTLRQKRSISLHHEFDYNLELLKFAVEDLNKFNSEGPKFLELKAASDVAGQPQKNAGPRIVVHPGMAGSARNWSATTYAELIQLLLSKNSALIVQITGTAMDESWVAPLRSQFSLEARVEILQNKLNTKELLKVLSEARVVIAPSTGVLHLAAALGTPTIGIYSPIRVQTPLRWGARGLKSINLAPQVQCPAQHHCLGKNCVSYDCMTTITSKLVAEKSLTSSYKIGL